MVMLRNSLIKKSYEECLEVGMSPAQREVFLVIDEWWKRHGYSPSIRDIAYVRGKMGLGSTQKIVERLVKLKVLKKMDGAGRTIRPVYIQFRNLE
jgi:SOS-response transcriptional repressor LexA